MSNAEEIKAFTAKCRNPGVNPQKLGKLTWREILFDACDIIDRQAEQIAKYKAASSKVACMWCSADIPADRSADEGFPVFLGKMAEHLLECKKHPLARKITELVDERSLIQDARIEELRELAELRARLKAFEKNLHEECAASAQTVRLLQKWIKAQADGPSKD